MAKGTQETQDAPDLKPGDPSTPVPPAEWGDQGSQAEADAEALAQANKNVTTPGDTDPGVRAAENAAAPTNGNGNRSAKAKAGVVDTFLSKIKGVKKDDVIAYNDERQTVVTAQGGKYQYRDGAFFTLSGPVLEGTLATTVVTPLQPISHPNGAPANG